ncbi:GGDEF domain-containing phosphodiesterase [Octadecabacter sp. 1_MG-2023]|uniref:GGDEF domain-containing phosphodiesterase n=1 Tax=unclassified Octadecabacter TaxID=196158 RepID=UPI001C091625|nr:MULTISPECIES: GGDEF domain-containing phosphodiesterase [unclassified Octadecabacter]MBU2991649.1 GGDEF domain-containing phosphodiesterase [Octadecabacter sp. B2R22]MDO6736175.1 GGDEF domain-containing phosphodiesterase [Octadecabacter sp. 1_MG-2023]
MQFLAKFPNKNRQIVFATLSFGASSSLAFVALGVTGLAAAFIFAPLLVAHLIRPNAAPSERAGEQQEARPFIIGCLSRFLGQIGHPTGAMIIEIDDHDRLEETHGRGALDRALVFVQSALDLHLTETDVVASLDGYRFAVALAPLAPYDLETMLNTCTRIQQSMSTAPLSADLPPQMTVSIGFASSCKLENPTGEGLMQAAYSALAEARRNGPNAVRGYSPAVESKRRAAKKTAAEAKAAFERGEFFAYFQPQINLSSGELSGFEALARWHHPDRGILTPPEFLPALAQAGLMQKLGDTMIKQAVQALSFWDTSGLDVPCIGVNFSSDELCCPHLVERIAMHLEVGGIDPNRLAIEVLETVIAGGADDEIVGNLAALADLGCSVDLDDFGTGYASITNIRRFSVGRIKIDRSFISGVDLDLEQRSMVAAIVTMAERLNVKTLAEGVETKGELSVLKSIGCADAQGFQLARPMPIQETLEWAAAYMKQPNAPIQLSRRAS